MLAVSQRELELEIFLQIKICVLVCINSCTNSAESVAVRREKGKLLSGGACARRSLLFVLGFCQSL